MIEKVIRALLLADPAVAAIVGDRCLYGVMPQRAVFPRIAITKIDKRSAYTLHSTVGPNEVRVQVDCWAETIDGVRGLAEVVNGSDDQATRGPLHAYSGTVDGLGVKLIELLVERAAEYEPDTKLYRVSADYRAHL